MGAGAAEVECGLVQMVASVGFVAQGGVSAAESQVVESDHEKRRPAVLSNGESLRGPRERFGGALPEEEIAVVVALQCIEEWVIGLEPPLQTLGSGVTGALRSV